MLTWRTFSLVPQGALSKRSKISLFDHLVGANEQRRWHCEAERVRGFEVD
jgi:hypothetical protein